tara:strand:+ start:569 stop:1195 length:627 start_codon:yes stop_codon:yes gene_type:complete
MNIEKKINKIIIISSPSGAGKTTICNYLVKKLNNIDLSISYTTRSKRTNELNSKDYYFVNNDKFTKLKNKNFFIETANVFNNLYGSPYKNISNAFKKNHHILFDIDWQGARKLRKKYKNTKIIDIFILPPNKKELKNRLIKRGRDNNKEINLRMSLALNEIKHYKEYKYVLINESIKNTINNLIKIIDFEILIEKNNNKLNSNLKKFQ